MSGHVLIVEDEPEIAQGISLHLSQEGFTTTVVGTGQEALDSLGQVPNTSVVLLDLMLPDMSGNEVCRKLRATGSSIPIIMVSARSDEIDKVVGFELGVDDYITKPFSLRELGLRVHAVVRRSKTKTTPKKPLDPLIGGDIYLCPASHKVWVKQEEVNLRCMEFRLLEALLERQGRVQTRSTLLEDVWGTSEYITTRTVDTHIKRLRENLGSAGDHIETIRGIGYRFRVV